MKDQVLAALAGIAEGLRMDGGDIELVDLDEATGKVSVRLKGACRGCPHAQVTLRTFVERQLKAQVEGVTEVEEAVDQPDPV
jgi:Fe-S cluster biogenesis protein NfuA